MQWSFAALAPMVEQDAIEFYSTSSQCSPTDEKDASLVSFLQSHAEAAEEASAQFASCSEDVDSRVTIIDLLDSTDLKRKLKAASASEEEAWRCEGRMKEAWNEEREAWNEEFKAAEGWQKEAQTWRKEVSEEQAMVLLIKEELQAAAEAAEGLQNDAHKWKEICAEQQLVLLCWAETASGST